MAIFDEVCDLPPDARRAALDRRCDGDAAIRRRVEQMLATESAHDAPLADSDHGVGARIVSEARIEAEAEAARPPDRIGRYRVIRELGRGGMGVVYEAEQENPRRRVALKVIRRAYVSPSLIRRFRQESHILGRLRHPGITQVIEAGTTNVHDEELPFFTMELVDGEPLDVAARALRIRERVELVARVCDAVQHAHQFGVIHRDLKPANILVVRGGTGGVRIDDPAASLIDAIGQPKVTDFGVARLVDSDSQITTVRTHAGQVVGTLGYMSPEQLDGRSGEVDTRCDVYALGVILYHTLVGRLPHDLDHRPIAEAARIVHDEEPARLGSIDRGLRGDLETIVAKAIDRDPARRYAAAAALADDLRRYLAGEPITAHPPSALYQMRKFASRNRGLVIGLSGTVAALVIGLAGTTYFLVQATRQRDVADAERGRTVEVAAFQSALLKDLTARRFGSELLTSLRSEFAQAVEDVDGREAEMAAFNAALDRVNATNVGRDVLSDILADSALRRIEKGATDDPITEARLRDGLGDLYGSLGLRERSIVQYERVVELLRASLGPDHPDTLAAMNMVGVTYREMGRVAEAGSVFRETLERRQRVLGPEHADTLMSFSNLGGLLSYAGELDEAERYVRAALEGSDKLFGPEDEETLNRRNLYATLLYQKQEFDQALDHFRPLLELRERHSGPDHRRTILVRNNLVATLIRANRPDEAEPIAHAVLASSCRVHGDTHPSSIMALNNLGMVLIQLDKTTEADVTFRAAAAHSRAELNPEHEVRMKSISNLIDTRLALDAAVEAESLCHELLGVRRALNPPNPVLVAQTLEQLGHALYQQERFADCRDAWQECVDLRAGVAEAHWLTNRARSELGQALTALGEFEKAEKLLLASESALAAPAAEIPAVAGAGCVDDARARLVSLYEAWGKSEEADKWRGATAAAAP